MNAAIIVAAGRGERMHSKTNKIFLPLLGVPVLLHTVRVFVESGLFGEIRIVCSAENRAEMQDMLRKAGYGHIQLVPGGATRQASVRAGLLSLPEETELVAIHDGARPLVTAETGRRAVAQAEKKGSAVAAVPLKDTIKRAGADGLILETPDRSELYTIQTPQVFEFGLIKRAYEKLVESCDELRRRGVNITDDAMVVEYLAGCKVKLVEASYRNIKVTTPDDIVTALGFLKEKQ